MTTESCSRLLILGCGYLGRRVAERAVTERWEVHALTRSSRKAAELRQAGIRPVSGTLPLPPADGTLLPEVDTVLWCVGFDRTADRRAVWVKGVESVIRRLQTKSPPRRFCLVSSVSVYGDRQGGAVDERTQPHPSTESGQACLEMECRATELLADHLPLTQLTILRLGGIYGPGRLLRRVQSMQRGEPLPGTGREWLNLIHVDDAAAVIRSVLTGRSAPPLINVVSPSAVTRQEYYAQLAELSGTAAPTFIGDAAEAAGIAGKGRRPSGNKRVVSQYLAELDAARQYDDVGHGLRQAIENSQVSE